MKSPSLGFQVLGNRKHHQRLEASLKISGLKPTDPHDLYALQRKIMVRPSLEEQGQVLLPQVFHALEDHLVSRPLRAGVPAEIH